MGPVGVPLVRQNGEQVPVMGRFWRHCNNGSLEYAKKAGPGRSEPAPTSAAIGPFVH